MTDVAVTDAAVTDAAVHGAGGAEAGSPREGGGCARTFAVVDDDQMLNVVSK